MRRSGQAGLRRATGVFPGYASLRAPRPAAVWQFVDGQAIAPFTLTRAAGATRRDGTGTPVAAAANEPRIDHDAAGRPLGLLLEFGRTNVFLNAATPATHTSGSLSNGTYTLWLDGTGSIEVAANTATVGGAGTATAAAPVTFTVSSPGTVDFTVTGAPTRAQCETGAERTSFIPTAGAAASRAADVCALDLSLVPGLSPAGLSVAVWLRPVRVTGSGGGFLILQNGSNNDDDVPLLLGGSAGQMDLRLYSGGSAFAQFAPSGAFTANVATAVAFGWQANSMRAYVGGVAAGATDTTITVPAALTVLRLGDATGYWGGVAGCWVERLALFDRRLPDDALRALSL